MVKPYFLTQLTHLAMFILGTLVMELQDPEILLLTYLQIQEMFTKYV